MKIYTINLNSFENFTIFKKKLQWVLNVTNANHYVNIFLDMKNNEIHIDEFSKSISINTIKNSLKDDSVKNLNFVLKNFFINFFFKIKFNGKGFRLQSFKTKKLINFTFGHSHKMYMHFPLTFFKRNSKYKYFFKSKRLDIKNYLMNKLKTVRPINKYTLRGLRITRTTIIKRKGRKSPTL